MASKSELLLQLLDNSGFDSPKHALNYASKASEKFKSAPSAKQYRALTRALWNAKPKSKQELFTAMMARLDAKPGKTDIRPNLLYSREQLSGIADRLLGTSEKPATNYADYYANAEEYLADREVLNRFGKNRAKDVTISRQDAKELYKSPRKISNLEKEAIKDEILSRPKEIVRYDVPPELDALIDEILENSHEYRNSSLDVVESLYDNADDIELDRIISTKYIPKRTNK